MTAALAAAARGRQPPAALDALRARGLRVSSARRLVLEALFAADGPVSAEEIAGGLDGRCRRSDLASVYRNLDTLEQVGLVRHVHLGHGAGLYALAGRDQPATPRASAAARTARSTPRPSTASRAALRETCGYDAHLVPLPDRRRPARSADACTSLTAS